MSHRRMLQFSCIERSLSGACSYLKFASDAGVAGILSPFRDPVGESPFREWKRARLMPCRMSDSSLSSLFRGYWETNSTSARVSSQTTKGTTTVHLILQLTARSKRRYELRASCVTSSIHVMLFCSQQVPKTPSPLWNVKSRLCAVKNRISSFSELLSTMSCAILDAISSPPSSPNHTLLSSILDAPLLSDEASADPMHLNRASMIPGVRLCTVPVSSQSSLELEWLFPPAECVALSWETVRLGRGLEAELPSPVSWSP
mmetsp:Transcript_9589/g.23647  ORF Transcript_9589/g.23647 Transcript_9589/m.23647 type:complete len:259 (+) Transcript_9589:1012-1788(+)